MQRKEKLDQQTSPAVSILPIPETRLRSSIQVLNRIIVELRKTEMDIQKISFFEEPLLAIIHVNKPEPRKTKWSWLPGRGKSKRAQSPQMRLRVNVTKAPDVQNLFLMKYERLPGEA